MTYPQLPQPVGAAAPEPPQRPALAASVAIATELWLVVIAALAVAQLGSYPLARDAMDQHLAGLPKDASESARRSAELMTNPGLIIATLVVAVLVGAVIALIVMYFLRAGHNWARLILSGLSAYVLVGAVMAFTGQPTWTQAPQIIAAGCAGGALLLLMRRDSDTYCREMGEFRALVKAPAVSAAGQPGGWSQQGPAQQGPAQQYPAQPHPPQQYPNHPGAHRPPPTSHQPPDGAGGTRE